MRLREYIVFDHLPLSKDKTDFFITSRYPRVLSAFGVIFQEKIELYLKRSIFKKLYSYHYFIGAAYPSGREPC